MINHDFTNLCSSLNTYWYHLASAYEKWNLQMKQSLYTVAPCTQISFVGIHILPTKEFQFWTTRKLSRWYNGQKCEFWNKTFIAQYLISLFKRMLKKMHCSLQITRHKSICHPIARLQIWSIMKLDTRIIWAALEDKTHGTYVSITTW